MPENSTARVANNNSVIDLLKIMKDNKPSEMADLLSILAHIDSMEKQLDAAVNELAEIRRDLAEARKFNNPIAGLLHNAETTLQSKITELHEKLTELKTAVINGCKNALDAVKQNGFNALDKVAKFFNVKPLLENMRDDLAKNISSMDKIISRIESVSSEYHETGKHIKNIGRALTGKEPVQEAKPNGAMARAFEAPFKTERNLFSSMKDNVENAIGSIMRLEEKAAVRKPTIKDTLTSCDKKAETELAAKPAPDRSKKVEMSL